MPAAERLRKTRQLDVPKPTRSLGNRQTAAHQHFFRQALPDFVQQFAIRGALGAEPVREGRGGVSFGGSPETAYRACLWSRTASRVLLKLARVPAADADVLYAAVLDLPCVGPVPLGELYAGLHIG